MNVSGIFISHYEKNVDRRAYLDNFFKTHNITNYEYVINDRKDIGPKVPLWNLFQLEQDIKLPFNYIERAPCRKLNKSHIANIISHYESIERISRDTNESLYLILEDDAIFCDNFIEKFNKHIESVPKDLDIGYIVSGCDLHVNESIITNDIIWYEEQLRRSRTACAYIISTKCARKMMKEFVGFFYPIDWHLTYESTRIQLKIYWCEPTIVSEGSNNGHYASSAKYNGENENNTYYD